MPTIQAHVSGDELLKAAEQLTPAELQEFVAGVLVLRAQRQAPHLSAEESKLLLSINQGLPEELCNRLNTLIAKRDDDTLTNEEHQELIQLTDQVEQRQAERAAALGKLAILRKTSLTSLMDQLGIKAPSNGQ